MNEGQIIALILGSSVISSFISGFITYFITERNYKRDYYKKIIERRIESLERVLAISNQLKKLVYFGKGEFIMCPFSTVDSYHKFIAQLFISADDTFWLSDNLSGIIQELNIFVLNKFSPLDTVNESNFEELLVKIGKTQFEELRSHREKLDECLMRDFSTILNVKQFLAAKTGGYNIFKLDF